MLAHHSSCRGLLLHWLKEGLESGRAKTEGKMNRLTVSATPTWCVALSKTTAGWTWRQQTTPCDWGAFPRNFYETTFTICCLTVYIDPKRRHLPLSPQRVKLTRLFSFAASSGAVNNQAVAESQTNRHNRPNCTLHSVVPLLQHHGV